jgi:hypothetical protein
LPPPHFSQILINFKFPYIFGLFSFFFFAHFPFSLPGGGVGLADVIWGNSFEKGKEEKKGKKMMKEKRKMKGIFKLKW